MRLNSDGKLSSASCLAFKQLDLLEWELVEEFWRPAQVGGWRAWFWTRTCVDLTSHSKSAPMPLPAPPNQTQHLTAGEKHTSDITGGKQAGRGAGAGGRPRWLECDICVERKEREIRMPISLYRRGSWRNVCLVASCDRRHVRSGSDAWTVGHESWSVSAVNARMRSFRGMIHQSCDSVVIEDAVIEIIGYQFSGFPRITQKTCKRGNCL